LESCADAELHLSVQAEVLAVRLGDKLHSLRAYLSFPSTNLRRIARRRVLLSERGTGHDKYRNRRDDWLWAHWNDFGRRYNRICRDFDRGHEGPTNIIQFGRQAVLNPRRGHRFDERGGGKLIR
jgi:hypothetical protein